MKLAVGDKITSVGYAVREVYRGTVAEADAGIYHPKNRAKGPWFTWTDGQLRAVPEAYADEGIEWVRGWEGPEVDALIVTLSLSPRYGQLE